MRIIFYFFFAASSTLIFKNPVIGLLLALVGTAYTRTPIEAIAALAGTTLASVLKTESRRDQITFVLVSSLLHVAGTLIVQSVLQELLVGFLIVLTIKGCLLL